ncbi:MAG: multidrug efflux SMR transporter [Prochloraceae cyanobacterium]
MNVIWNAWFLICFAAVNNSLAAVLLKRSRFGAPPGSSLASMLLSPWFIFALVFYAANVFLFAKALEKLAVSTVYPVYAGLAVGLVAIAGNYFFGERLNLNQYIGIGVILAGIIIASRS